MSSKALLSWVALFAIMAAIGSAALIYYATTTQSTLATDINTAYHNHLSLEMYSKDKNSQWLDDIKPAPSHTIPLPLQQIYETQARLKSRLLADAVENTDFPQSYQSAISQLPIIANAELETSTNQQLQILFITGLAFAVLTLFLSFYVWFMRTKHFSPLYRIVNTLRAQALNGAPLSVGPTNSDADVKRLTHAIHAATTSQSQKLASAAIIESYNRELKSITGSEPIVRHALEFIANEFNAPSVCLYANLEDSTVSLVKSHGVTPSQSIITSTIELCAANNEPQIQQEPLWLKAQGAEIKIQGRYCFPLTIGNHVVYVLLVGSAQSLIDSQFEALEYLCKDLSLALAINENIEKQQKTESALSEQLELTHHIINAIPNPTYYRSTDGVFMGVNKSFLALLDQFEVDVIGAKLDEVFDLGIASLFESKAHEIITTTQEQTYEVLLLDGQEQARELIVYEAPFFNENGAVAGVVGMYLDVSERNQLQRELIEAKDLAQNSAKAKSEFLANMSHEIRTPMNAIIGMSHLALATELNAKQHDYVSKIDTAAKQLLRLINDILDFSKIEAGKIELEYQAFSTEKLLDSVATIVSVKAQEKQLELVFDLDSQVPYCVIGDQFRISQVLINLAGNAVKFTETGEVVIRVALVNVEKGLAKIKFSVKDSGIGMNKRQQKNLFQSFSQADNSITRKYGGTGLGLTISQQLVKLMGGEIYVESEENVGSEFYFTLEMEVSDELSQAKMASTHLSGLSATIIDDNQHALDVLSGMLTNFGMQVCAYLDPHKALNQFVLTQDLPDLIFVDWHMPKIDGIELITKLQSQIDISQSKFILVTAYGRELNLNDSQANLVDGVLLKPINPSNLVDVIQNAVFDSPEVRTTITKKEQTISKQALNGISILVAEDQPVNQEIAVEILSSFGAQVSVADNGQEAIEQVHNKHIDIVLMDMQMPVMDGITATQNLRMEFDESALPILAMTANAMEEDIQTCIDAGMNDHVAKPIDVEQLVNSILKYANAETDILSTEPVATPPEASAEVEEVNEVIEFEGIDIAEGIARAAGNQKVYFDILEKFLSQQVEELINLKQALAIENFELAHSMLHALKGASANLSIVKLTEEFKQIEASLNVRPPNASEIDELIKYVKYAQEQCQKRRKREASQQVENVMKNNEATAGNSQLEELIQLACALRDYDTQATELVDSISVSSYLTEPELQKLKTAIARFEFNEAFMMLTSIKHVEEAPELNIEKGALH
ncbi:MULTISPECIES: response regulator [Pseudoalteromonas]|uniref:PAS domain-containing hybrid sensor histidine kinase/response regulator n=1 Tax=Pseudoalteromonas TaxID=53246 RepID=UPI000FFE73C3|nr:MULTISPECIES: response regulator [Pseudoalteromonas]NKC19023.1 response regulator [Pseudoalteromonas galatheae]RXE88992.1 histidine kinase [Pseudoalteromonas sp. A757]